MNNSLLGSLIGCRIQPIINCISHCVSVVKNHASVLHCAMMIDTGIQHFVGELNSCFFSWNLVCFIRHLYGPLSGLIKQVILQTDETWSLPCQY